MRLIKLFKGSRLLSELSAADKLQALKLGSDKVLDPNAFR